MALEMATAEIMDAVRAQTGNKPNELIVKFYRDGMVDERQTYGWVDQKFDEHTGMPGPLMKHPGKGGAFFRNAICIEIRAPGEKDEIRRREVRDIDKYRFAKEWDLFEKSEKGLEGAQDGTPLTALPFLSPAQILEFKAAGIQTAENLANVSDVNGQKFMDFQRVRQRAKDFVAAAAGAAPLVEIRAENESLKEQIVALQKQMKEVVEKQDKRKG